MDKRSRTGLLLILSFAIPAASFANDIEKLIDKAEGQGKKALLKGVGNFTKSNLLNKGATPATGAGAAASPAASPAAATTAATGAAKSSPTAIPASATVNTTAAGTNPAAAASAAKPGMKEKIESAASKEIGRAVNKYGTKYLQQGEKQVDKMLGN